MGAGAAEAAGAAGLGRGRGLRRGLGRSGRRRGRGHRATRLHRTRGALDDHHGARGPALAAPLATPVAALATALTAALTARTALVTGTRPRAAHPAAGWAPASPSGFAGRASRSPLRSPRGRSDPRSRSRPPRSSRSPPRPAGMPSITSPKVALGFLGPNPPGPPPPPEPTEPFFSSLTARTFLNEIEIQPWETVPPCWVKRRRTLHTRRAWTEDACGHLLSSASGTPP